MTADSVSVCIPTLNAGATWSEALEALDQQTLPHVTLVIDSGSLDGTVERAQQSGARVISIDGSTFDHGATRQLAVELAAQSEFLVFMTQDAVLATPDALAKLIARFKDARVGAAYGRQLPRYGAHPIEAHARLFNYPAQSRLTSEKDIATLGMKAAFLSNSFAAYRRSALMEAGGFPAHTLVSEDMLVGARMLLNGWKLAYVAESCAYHSHNYTPAQEFRRYFDIGALHVRESWLLETLGSPEGEGRRFVQSELRYLLRNAPGRIPSALLRTLTKYLGYRLGRLEHRLPRRIKRRMSMHKTFWVKERP